MVFLEEEGFKVGDGVVFELVEMEGRGKYFVEVFCGS